MAASSVASAVRRRSRQLFDIFVAEVPWTVSSKELKEYFSQFGSVQRCQLPFRMKFFIDLVSLAEELKVFELRERNAEQPLLGPHMLPMTGNAIVKKVLQQQDRDTGFHRRYCWIKFSTPQDVQNVLQKDSHILEGSKLALKQQTRRRRSQRRTPRE